METSTPRPDRHDDVLRSGRAQQPDGLRRWLLDGLEQGIRASCGNAIRVLDDDHLMTTVRRVHRRSSHQFTHFVDTDGQRLGADQGDVRMSA